MRILWLYKHDPDYDFDKWLHLEYVKFLSQYPNVEIIAYGPGIKKSYPELAPITYNEKLSIEDIYRITKFEIIILNTKSRMFKYYSPRTGVSHGCWLPKNFNHFNRVPKVMIEEDYHYEMNDSWYRTIGITLILQRHYGNMKRPMTVSTKWFPFSVDTKIFKPNNDISRINKIGFVGSNTSDYIYRNLALRKLKQAKLIDTTNEYNYVFEEKYTIYLQKYIAYLSGCSRYNITPAKMFEIMASGTVLFTNNHKQYGLNQLFPEDTYWTYNSDGSDVISQTKILLSDKEKVEEIAKKALTCIQTKHTHEIRTKQLLDIIKKEV